MEALQIRKAQKNERILCCRDFHQRSDRSAGYVVNRPLKFTSEIKLSNEIPNNWIALTKKLTNFTPLNTRLDVENPATKVTDDANEKIQMYTEKLIQTIKETIFPIHKI